MFRWVLKCQALFTSGLIARALVIAPQGLSSFDDAPLSPKPPIASNLESVRPLYWVHIPKCGTQFLNLLLTHEKICPIAVKLKATQPDIKASTPGDAKTIRLMQSILCPGSLAPAFYDLAMHQSPSLNNTAESFKGHGMIMLRQPEQRMLSAYHAGVTDRHISGSYPHSWPLYGREIQPRDIFEYVEQQQGCQVKVLTGPPSTALPDPCFSWKPPSTEDVTRAKRMLHEDMAFVGLTDEWDLSVCLFHAMFGGKCGPEEFKSIRRGPKRPESGLYNTSELNGVQDPFDGPLYEEAASIFKTRLDLYGVTRANCPSMCSDVGR